MYTNTRMRQYLAARRARTSVLGDILGFLALGAVFYAFHVLLSLSFN